MANERTLEERLEALERAVADLQRRLDTPPARGNWLERITGSMKDEPAFEEVLAYGRAFRQADRPPEDAGAGP
jgi:hypothetical protein